MISDATANFARELDRRDILAKFRDEFVFYDPDMIYLDGNSLGRLPKRTQNRLRRLIDYEWGEDLIRSWDKAWITLPERLGAKIASLVGADESEVILSDSTSVNLFKLAFAALRRRANCKKIVTDDLNFPSDIYVLESVTKLFGPDYELRVVLSPDGITMPAEKFAREIDDQTALVSLSHTVFKSGFVHDMPKITQLTHSKNAYILWDLSHSTGAIDFSLNDSNVDLAVGCTYKYLNGGPGAPAFLYVRNDLQNELENPITGWFGHKDPFNFNLGYQPVAGIRRFLTGTPAVLSLAAVEYGVDLILEAGIKNLRKKSQQQTEYLISLWEILLKPLNFDLKSPIRPDQRGSHVSFGHEEGFRISRALMETQKVITDFRTPDTIRFGIAPLYTSYMDLFLAVRRMKQVVTGRIFENYPKNL